MQPSSQIASETGLLILATHVLTEGSFFQLTTAAGTIMYVICDYGYQLRTMTNINLTCLVDGTWDNYMPVCDTGQWYTHDVILS